MSEYTETITFSYYNGGGNESITVERNISEPGFDTVAQGFFEFLHQCFQYDRETIKAKLLEEIERWDVL